MVKQGASPYREVRSLERGLILLEALGRMGWSTPTMLTKETGIERSTIYRILNTLEQMNYVARRQGDGKFFLTPKMQRIGHDVRREDLDLQVVSQGLESLVERIFWPSDFAVLLSGHLTIMASSHQLTSMSIFRGVVGSSRPLLRSSLGRALLCAMSAEELEQALEMVRLGSGPDVADIADPKTIRRIIDDTLARGYAVSAGLIDPKISAIALPVRRRERVAGAVNIVYFRSAMTTEEAAARYLDPLKACVAEIEQRLADSEPLEHASRH